MSRLKVFGRSAVALWLPLALGVPGCTDGPLASRALTEAASPDLAAVPRVPFRMTATVDVDQMNPVIPPPAPCLVLFNSAIEGNATHLGRLTGVGSTCGLSQVLDPDPPFLPPGGPPYVTVDFTNPLWTLTAANGDELWMTAQGVAVISLVDGSLRARGVQQIIGGTGRFANATGTLQARGVNEDGQGPDDFQSSGWIRFRASDRARR